MKRNSQWIIACTVLWLSACSTLPRPVGPDTEERRQAAVQTRWIGVPKIWTGKCPGHPSTSDWRVQPLVALKELKPSLARSVQKAGLDRFCLYEYKGTGRISRDLMPPRKILAQLRSVEPDHLALSSMSTLQATTSPHFSQRFFQQMQIPEDLSLIGTPRVRLVFLDTQPTGEGLPGGTPKSRHGYTLGHIAGHLAGYETCGSNCTVEVASRLALPVVRFDPEKGTELERNEDTGGFRGSFVDLAQAIVEEIIQWQQDLRDPKPSRLVLNLSVGWDGEKFGGWNKEQLELYLENEDEDEDEDEGKKTLAGLAAVYGALKVAAEQGVLVIAAAGNDRGGPEPTGQPLLPGGWEKWNWEGGNPLIYAASGVDGFGRQLVNTRRQGEARRVAYADHVTVPDLHNPTVYTATLTGTSVATAVISTIAAIVWSYKSALEPKDVMGTLYESGTGALGRNPDFSPPATVGPVQRITLCQALAKAWEKYPELPDPDPTCGAIPALAPINLSLTFQPQVDLDPLFTPEPTDFRPHRDTQDQALCGPQPGVNPCPNCVVDPPAQFRLASTEITALADTLYENTMLTNDYRVLVELPDPEWGVLKEATLEIFEVDLTGKREEMPDINSISLQGPGNMEVTFSAPTGSFQAALTFVLAPDANAPPASYLSVVNPLFVDVP